METILIASDEVRGERLPPRDETGGAWPGRLRETIARHPQESLLGGVGAGYLLAHLPLLRMSGAVVRLGFMLLRPALLVYAVVKLSGRFRRQEG